MEEEGEKGTNGKTQTFKKEKWALRGINGRYGSFVTKPVKVIF